MPASHSPKGKPAARIRRDGFSYLFSTATRIYENDYYHIFKAARNCA